MQHPSRESHKLLHMQIKDAILEEYPSRNTPENTPFPSVRELVKKFNSSIATVNKALDELKKAGAIYSLPNVGTFWGKRKNLTRYKTVGVRFNVASLTNITPDTYFFHMLQGIEEVFAKHGLHTKLLRYESLDSMEGIRDLNCDGIICTGTYAPALNAVHIFRKLGIPYLLLDRPNNDESLNYLERDSAGNIEAMIDYLVARGHTRVCCVGPTPALWIDRKLYVGFEAGMKKHQFDIFNAILQLPKFTLDNLEKVNLKEVLREHSALMILSPMKSDIETVFEYCDRNDISVPSDLAVISLAAGSLTIGARAVTSHVTTPYEMGVKAAKGIVALLNNDVEEPLHIEFPLMMREGGIHD